MRERRTYQAVFAANAAVLVACLILGGTSLAYGVMRQACYVVGAVSALVCVHAAWKLHCAERAKVTADGAWLNDVQGRLDDIGDWD